MKTVFTNGLIVRGNGSSQSEPVLGCMVVEDDKIAYIGAENDESVAQGKQAPGVEVVDLHRRTVIPGFIDGYVSLIHLFNKNATLRFPYGFATLATNTKTKDTCISSCSAQASPKSTSGTADPSPTSALPSRPPPHSSRTPPASSAAGGCTP